MKRQEVIVSGVARGQWKQLCKGYYNCDDTELITNKIIRAYYLGQIVHFYNNGNYITRYHDLNILLSESEIQTIWRDITRPSVFVDEEVKRKYDQVMEVGDW